MAEHTLMELKKNIKQGILAPVYLFYGEERFLIDMYIEKISALIDDGGLPEFNRLVVEDNQTSLADILDYIDTYPMMSEKKLLVLNDLGFLKKADEETKEAWKNQLENLPDHIVIIFVESEIDKRNVIYKAIDKAGFSLEFKFLSEADLVTWVERQFLNQKKKIKKENAQYLVSICDEGLGNLKNETDKLASFCEEEVTRSDIERLVSKSLNTKVFEMTDAIMAHDAKTTLLILSDLKTINEPAFKIMYVLFSAFDKMLQGSLMYEEGEGIDVISKKLKIPSFIAKKYIKKNFERDFLVDCIIKIPEIDYGIKEGRYSDWDALSDFVMSLFKK